MTFTQEGDTVTFKGEVFGLTEGKHGFHIHTRDSCVSPGPHFNPFKTDHGGPGDKIRHVGDLGNIESDSNMKALVDAQDTIISLNGRYAIVKRALNIHLNEDDLGKGGTVTSLTNGNAGPMISCGILKPEGGNEPASTPAADMAQHSMQTGIYLLLMALIIVFQHTF